LEVQINRLDSGLYSPTSEKVQVASPSCTRRW